MRRAAAAAARLVAAHRAERELAGASVARLRVRCMMIRPVEWAPRNSFEIQCDRSGKFRNFYKMKFCDHSAFLTNPTDTYIFYLPFSSLNCTYAIWKSQ